MPTRPAVHLSAFAALVAGLVLLLTLPGQAAAAKPCWRQILDDWTAHGHIQGTYPIHCYREALRNLPEDVRDYSSAADDIQAALQRRLTQQARLRHPQVVGTPDSRSDNGGSPNPDSGNAKAGPERSLYRRAIDNLGTSNADSLPIPLLVLGSLGALLLLTAAGLAATKRIKATRAGRGTPPTAGS